MIENALIVNHDPGASAPDWLTDRDPAPALLTLIARSSVDDTLRKLMVDDGPGLDTNTGAALHDSEYTIVG